MIKTGMVEDNQGRSYHQPTLAATGTPGEFRGPRKSKGPGPHDLTFAFKLEFPEAFFWSSTSARGALGQISWGGG